MYCFALIVLVLVAMPDRIAAQPLGPGTHDLSLRTPDGRTREFFLHVPTRYNSSRPMALVFDSHGYTSNARQQATFTGYRDVADAETFAVIHAQGWDDSWNAETCCGTAMTLNIDDVTFFRMMIDYTAGRVNIDRSRIFATGMSNGGFISHRLGVEASDVFNAIGPVAATVPYFLGRPGLNVGVYHIHGTEDALVPYDGSAIFRGAEDSMDYWRDHNGCGIRTEITDRDNEDDTVCETFVDCPENRLLTLCTHDSGHIVPSYTAEKTWEFFVSQPARNATATA